MAGLRPDGEGLRLRLDADEVAVLVSLLDGLAERVAAASAGDGPDEVVERLTPVVSRGDPEVDAELRAMLRDELLETRMQRLGGLASDIGTWAHGTGGAVDRLLDRAAAMRIVEALNDVRLALATTIGYEDDLREQLGPDDARADAIVLMDALAWLQGGLIEFVEGDA
jgi:hypothetical protein